MLTNTAQLRASKKWRENNKEQFLTIVYAWRKNNPEAYKEKQYGYIKKYQQRRAVLLKEFKRLSAILL